VGTDFDFFHICYLEWITEGREDLYRFSFALEGPVKKYYIGQCDL
jgi:hypothetical protein